MTTPPGDIWSDYWASGRGSPGGGCLPPELKAVDAAQGRYWAEVARRLPKRGQVLDLATGDGAVLAKIQRARPDLQLVGIDQAAPLPSPPRGIKLKGGVAMARLPFKQACFDLVTSQFGIEYADPAAAFPEVARVLRPSGQLAFLIHHADGPIVAHNRPRLEALHFVVEETGLLARAESVARGRLNFPLPTPPAFRAAISEMRARFPAAPVGADFAAAIFETLELGVRDDPRKTLQVLAELGTRARNDIGRIQSLQKAACDPDRLALLLDHASAAGLSCEVQGTLSENEDARPFAWVVRGTRQH